MRPWTVDADDIQLGEDFDPSVLHHTPGVDEFLDPRGSKFLVLGTKGLGKTLLLKARRIADQERMLCLPRNALIDKPIGHKIFGSEMITLFGSSTENWKKVWRMAIVAATLKAVGRADDPRVGPRFAAVLADDDLVGVMDHFVHLLDFSRADLFKSASEVDTHLIPRVRNLDSSVAIFIDSIDEYFNNHILEISPADAGELYPEIWYFAQMGLVEVAYELRRLTHHLKVFAAVRKEAFDRFGAATSMVQQYRGSAVDIDYSRESLRDIFVSNIAREKPKNLVDPSLLKSDPFAAFLGVTHVRHSHTGVEEDVEGHVLRHTLGRPRDLMSIGGALSMIPPPRRDAASVRRAVEEAATGIADEYLNEIAPFTHGLDLEAAFVLLPGDAITAADAEALVRRYNRRVGRRAGRGQPGILEFLYGAGLLGVVSTDHDGTPTQRFVRPGQHSYEEPEPVPRSSHLLVHPILSTHISRVNERFGESRDRANVIGHGRPWTERNNEQRVAVMKADIRGFSRIMNGEHEEEVLTLLHDVVEAHAAGCLVAEVIEGDSLTIIDENPRSILKVAKRIMEDLLEAPGNPELRVAVDWGSVELPGARTTVVRGTPFRVAARLEPHVEPGQIWVTETFVEALGDGPGFYDAVPLPEPVDIAKPGSTEPAEQIPVWRITERGGAGPTERGV